jgi:hypothetical protein
MRQVAALERAGARAPAAKAPAPSEAPIPLKPGFGLIASLPTIPPARKG